MTVYLAVPVLDTSVGRTGFDPMIFRYFLHLLWLCCVYSIFCLTNTRVKSEEVVRKLQTSLVPNYMHI